MSKLNENEWFKNLPEEGKYVIKLIIKYHYYFSKKDKKLKYTVRALKISVLLLAMTATIILGLKNWIEKDLQINTGLIISSFITFLTAISSFLNIERYWMRNITIHIELNKLRDSFIFEATAKKIDDTRAKYYIDCLDQLQTSNIKYWRKAIKKL
ncbi:MAG: SLATT domain-containing protein [Candidatus Paceibacterota bacterium]